MDAEKTDDPLDIALLNPPGADEEIPQFVDQPLPVLQYRGKGSAALPAPIRPKQNNKNAWRFTVRVVRKILFVGGLGLFAAALGETLEGRSSDSPATMGMGAVMVGLAIPLSRRSKK